MSSNVLDDLLEILLAKEVHLDGASKMKLTNKYAISEHLFRLLGWYLIGTHHVVSVTYGIVQQYSRDTYEYISKTYKASGENLFLKYVLSILKA